jgi:rhodanese-related sulfurtransferase
MIRRTLYEALLVTFIAIALSIGAYVMRPQVLPPTPLKTDAAQVKDEPQHFKTLSLEQAVKIFQDKTALFADARPRSIYLKGHIQGAVNLDPYEFDQWSDSFTEKVPPDTSIITYCDGSQCPLSTQLAEKLTWLGYDHVACLKNGWSLWQQGGLPTEAEK